MAERLIWSPSAILDLEEIVSYIAESRPRVASAFARGVFTAVDRISRFPLSGRVVPEFNDPDIRETIRKPCRIVYRVWRDEGVIEIVRVWHAARGIPEI